MWKRKSLCDELELALEGLRGPIPGDEVGLLEALPPAIRSHAAACQRCRSAVQSFAQSRRLMSAIALAPEEVPQWFSARVFAAIGEHEKVSKRGLAEWVAIPRLASRVALASAIALAVAGTWLYQAPAVTSQVTHISASAEYLFDNPATSADRDDALFSTAER